VEEEEQRLTVRAQLEIHLASRILMPLNS